MSRVLDIWRSWPVAQRAAVGALAGAILVGCAIGAYFIFKRPGDVANEDVGFKAAEVTKKVARGDERIDWPLYGLNRARTRYLPAKGLGPPFRTLWHFDAGELLEFSPIVIDSTIYVMNNDAEVFALNSSTGNVKWKREIGRLSASSPAYSHANDRLYLTTLEPGQAVALDAKTGKVEWRRQLPGRSESSPVVAAGRVYFGSESGDVFALDEDNGKVAWQTSVEGNVKAGPALHDGTLYVGDYAGKMYAMRTDNGEIRWDSSDIGASFGRSGRFYSTPAVSFGRVYAGNADGRVYSFDEGTGDVAWSQSLSGFVYAAPAVADAKGVPPAVFIGSNAGTAYALNARSGNEIWSTEVGGEISGAGSVVGDVFYLSDVDLEKTVGFDIGSGNAVFNEDRGAYNPVISDGELIFLTGYASIAALEPKRKKDGPGKKQKAEKKPKKQKKSKKG